jgi:hypothetical protein
VPTPRPALALLAVLLAASCASGSSPAKEKALCDGIAGDLVGTGP